MRKLYSLLLVALLYLCGGITPSSYAQGLALPQAITFVGTLQADMSAMGGELVTIPDQTLSMTATGDNSYTITLFDFNFGEMALGDIVVENVAVSVSDDGITLTGTKKGLSLSGGFIVADVACNGKLDMTTGLLVMDIGIETTNMGPMNMKIPVTFSGYPKSEETEESAGYMGTLTITVGEDVSVVENQAVSIIPAGDDVCTFSLYNFSLNGMSLGDIVIENVSISQADGNIIYHGSKEGLLLMGGAITADVECSGVEDASGHLKMDIGVTWMGMPIPVTFDGQRVSGGVAPVFNQDVDTPAEYFRVNGLKADAGSLTPGLYIVRQGNRTRKVIVR